MAAFSPDMTDFLGEEMGISTGLQLPVRPPAQPRAPLVQEEDAVCEEMDTSQSHDHVEPPSSQDSDEAEKMSQKPWSMLDIDGVAEFEA